MSYQKIKLKIGEFSKLCQVSVKTLRHYEKMGILNPMETDEWTGYRYYHAAQLKVMSNIQYLKRLGLSLEEIGDLFFEGRDVPDGVALDRLLRHCREEQRLLEWRCEELTRLESSQQVENVMNMETQDMNFGIKSLPAITVASHRRIINSYNELFSLCPDVIGPEMQRLGCECPEPGYCFTLDHNHKYCEDYIDIEYCEQVTERRQDSELIQFKDLLAVDCAVCYSHHGTYVTLPQSWARIYEYLERQCYAILDLPRFCYIDGVWNKEREEDWLTEIQVPVKKV